MASSNKKRLLLNVALLVVIASIIAFIVTREESTEGLHKTLYDKSIGDDAKELIIHSEDHDDVVIQLKDDVWKVIKPSSFVADKERIRHIFTLLSESAEISYDIKDKDLASYGLDKDRLSVSFNGVKMVFGKLNEISHKRYILKGDRMYLVAETVSGLMLLGEEGFRPQSKPVLTPIAEPETK